MFWLILVLSGGSASGGSAGLFRARCVMRNCVAVVPLQLLLCHYTRVAVTTSLHARSPPTNLIREQRRDGGCLRRFRLSLRPSSPSDHVEAGAGAGQQHARLRQHVARACDDSDTPNFIADTPCCVTISQVMDSDCAFCNVLSTTFRYHLLKPTSPASRAYFNRRFQLRRWRFLPTRSSHHAGPHRRLRCFLVQNRFVCQVFLRWS
jgi:hypothetical protein